MNRERGGEGRREPRAGRGARSPDADADVATPAPVAPPHDRRDWYGAYMAAREGGSPPTRADAAAGRHMADVKPVVVASA